jgi:Uma2 family endonuclease
MAQAQTKTGYTPEAYLALERVAVEKHEYLDGEIFAMAGASEAHNLIVANLLIELGRQLKGRPCKVYPSDMRVAVRPRRLYVYPDVIVTCGKTELEDQHLDTLLNPTVIFEVLSSSTERYDRGGKFESYRGIASLAEYVLVSQEKVHVEHYARQPDGKWMLSEASLIDATVELPAIGCRLTLSEVYDKTEIQLEKS